MRRRLSSPNSGIKALSRNVIAWLISPKSKPKEISLILFVAWIVMVIDVTRAGDQGVGNLTKTDFGAALAHPEDDGAFETFLRKLPTVTVGQGVTRTYYLLEGDLLKTREQVRATLFDYQNDPARNTLSTELKQLTDDNGQPVYWLRGHRTLTYAVDRASFPTKAEYDLVVKNMRLAALAWTGICPRCQVRFVHQVSMDDRPAEGGTTFIVTFNATQSDFIALSFFPNDEIYKHYLIVTPDYLTTDFNQVGILRHEIGHILGYRHEHIAGVPGCYSEDNNWLPLTPYDPTSVMHYFCGRGGTKELVLSSRDKTAHIRNYMAR